MKTSVACRRLFLLSLILTPLMFARSLALLVALGVASSCPLSAQAAQKITIPGTTAAPALQRPTDNASAKELRAYADALYWGVGVPRDRAGAASFYSKADRKGDLRSTTFLGRCFMYGDNGKENLDVAEALFASSVKSGDALAEYYLGVVAGKRKETAKAAELYRKSVPGLLRMAKSGDAWCQNALAIYYTYVAETKDYAQAMQWAQKAAQAGLPLAPEKIAYMYRDGLGVDRNLEKAFEYFRMAAIGGNEYGQAALGDCYYFGNGTKQNYPEAVKWYRAAAEVGHVDATSMLGQCYYLGSGLEVDYAAAFRCFSYAAEKNHSRAIAWVALCYGAGKGVGVDLKQYAANARRAAEMGDAFGMRTYGSALLYGEGASVDERAGRDWLNKAVQTDTTWAEDVKAILAKFEEKKARDAEARARAADWERDRIASRRASLPGEIAQLEREIDKLSSDINEVQVQLTQAQSQLSAQSAASFSKAEGFWQNALVFGASAAAAISLNDAEKAISAAKGQLERKRVELQNKRAEFLQLAR